MSIDPKPSKESIAKRSLAEKLRKAEKAAREKAIREREKFRGLQIRPTATLLDGEKESREPGDRNWSGLGFDIHPHVTGASVIVLVCLIASIFFFDEKADEVADAMKEWIATTFGWFFVFAANIFVIAAAYFAFSRLGRVKIGGKKAQPEFSTVAWYAMLLSAGMGIGLMFWSVGEPIYHYDSPSPMFSNVEGNTPEAAEAAMVTTFYHWGLHPWGIYAIVGLGLAFFAYNRGLPLTIRSIFYPILGDRIYGFWGNVIDVLSVLATLAGLATSLGLGVAQVNAGLDYLFGIGISVTIQIILIVVITGMATLSVVAGLDGGVKRLSEINMGLAAIFMVFLLLAGPTIYILSGFTQNIGSYLTILPELSFWTETYRGSDWQGGWTVFYWAWWISWSPFVGMFIARISKGRTVREFILGVVLIPTLLSFIWMSVFGGSAIWLQAGGIADIYSAVSTDVSTALFAMLESFPFTTVLSIIGIFLVTVFFVTSSDSGSLVVDHLTSGGKLDSPVPQRVFWALMEGVLAAVLLLGGGLQTLQTASITTGLPFTMILLCIIYTLYIGLSQEVYVEEAVSSKLKEVRADHRLDEAISTAQQEIIETVSSDTKPDTDKSGDT
ncbi:BCCT family transporter [Ruficoccus sp. ZRK36]|uniref:BCCT family transporter n=1 Tax=Ruficoccus sp. ZRK36 TaxID=2866311 RepID=UPI001C73B871|nr:BCCT family transporter [Ruficoccus sp. ZRK36]QYY35274.1 BCCT family transporter [Ruficoccus sp. ZRK36]